MEPRHHDHRYRKYADRVGITSSLKETRHYSATQLLTAGVDLKTVAGRLGHAEASATLRFYAQFTRPADQRAATVIPTQLDGLRKRERLRELFRQHVGGGQDLAALAAILGPQAGLEPETALPMLAGFAADGALSSASASLHGPDLRPRLPSGRQRACFGAYSAGRPLSVLEMARSGCPLGATAAARGGNAGVRSCG